MFALPVVATSTALFAGNLYSPMHENSYIANLKKLICQDWYNSVSLINPSARMREGYGTHSVCVCVGVSVSVCLSVCLLPH